MRNKSKITTFSILVIALFIGTTIQSAVAQDQTTASSGAKVASVSNDTQNIVSTPSTPGGGCPDCEQAVENAWNYAKEQADAAYPIPNVDLTGMGLIEKLNAILLTYRSTIRRHFIVFSVNFASKLNDELQYISFSIPEAMAGSVIAFFSGIIQTITDYGVFLAQAVLQGLFAVRDYVKALCSGEDVGGFVQIDILAQTQSLVQSAPSASQTQTMTQSTIVKSGSKSL